MTPTFKFFTGNRLSDACTYTFTSALTSGAVYLYDRKRNYLLSSVGSNDATPEVWEITFPAAKSISSIMIDNHNIKSGSCQYWNGSAWTSFSTAISLSANTATTSFFSFNEVSTLKIKFTFNTTMTANDQKRVGQIIAFNALGTPESAPSSYVINFKERSFQHQTATGGSVYVFFGKKAFLKVTFSDASYNDVALFSTLKELGEPFYFYPSGGLYSGLDTGLRIYDIYNVNYVNEFAPNLKSNVIELNQSVKLELAEI
jgi:hypothetical protein